MSLHEWVQLVVDAVTIGLLGAVWIEMGRRNR